MPQQQIQEEFICVGIKFIPTVGIKNKGETPEAFYLYQNYPNPFNPKQKLNLVYRRIITLGF